MYNHLAVLVVLDLDLSSRLGDQAVRIARQNFGCISQVNGELKYHDAIVCHTDDLRGEVYREGDNFKGSLYRFRYLFLKIDSIEHVYFPNKVFLSLLIVKNS
jgi:hypothetical protein